MKILKKVAPIGCFIIFFMCLFIPFIPIINNSSLYDENFIIDNQNPLDPPVEQEISIKEVLQQNLNNISGTGDALSGEKFCQIQGNELDKLGNSS
ncbi:MAG: hypothetical protein EAX96_15325, partial [Candidatus Lokiarchaeota archaeon]|nr:hypothetical protein [Candidatus Lokiarchaeota archaeon]